MPIALSDMAKTKHQHCQHHPNFLLGGTSRILVFFFGGQSAILAAAGVHKEIKLAADLGWSRAWATTPFSLPEAKVQIPLPGSTQVISFAGVLPWFEHTPAAVCFFVCPDLARYQLVQVKRLLAAPTVEEVLPVNGRHSFRISPGQTEYWASVRRRFRGWAMLPQTSMV
jgi:hypothetical protein